jgi:hypothetical protein
MARSTRSTTERAPSRPPHPNMAVSRAAGGAATTIRKLISAKDRQICGYPLQNKVGESRSFRLRRHHRAEHAARGGIGPSGRPFHPTGGGLRSRRPHPWNATGGCASESPLSHLDSSRLIHATPCRHPSRKQTDHSSRHCLYGSSLIPDRRRPARPCLPFIAAGSRPAERELQRLPFWCGLLAGEARGRPRGRRFTVAPQHPGGRCPLPPLTLTADFQPIRRHLADLVGITPNV